MIRHCVLYSCICIVYILLVAYQSDGFVQYNSRKIATVNTILYSDGGRRSWNGGSGGGSSGGDRRQYGGGGG